MNQFRDQYSNLEWMQIGILLVGLPLIALLGSVIGLVGKWRRGQIFSAVLWGMGCAAGVSFVALAAFIVAVLLEEAPGKTSWIGVFEIDASWRLTIAAISASGAIALVAGVILRWREGNSPVGAVSLRQLLLIQIFAFTALGCWIGMRSYAFSHATAFEKASHKWARRGWKVEGNTGGKVIMERTFEPASADWKRESEMLLQVCKEPWLGELRLFQLDNADALDFSAIADAKHLDVLSLRYHPMTMPPQSHIDTIAKVASLRELSIIGGDYSLVDLSPLLKLKSLQKVQLWDVTCDEEALRDLIRKLKLQHFALYQSTPRNNFPGSIACWQGYFALHRYKQPIGEGDLNWVEPEWVTRLQLDGSELTLEAAKKIAQMPNVDYVDLNCRVEGPALAEIAKCAKLRHAFILEFGPPQGRAAFDPALDEFLMAPKLQVIDWNWGVMKPELDYPPPSEEERRLIELRQRPAIQFNRPATAEQAAYVEQINRRRAERKLGKLTINPNDQMRQQLLNVPVETP